MPGLLRGIFGVQVSKALKYAGTSDATFQVPYQRGTQGRDRVSRVSRRSATAARTTGSTRNGRAWTGDSVGASRADSSRVWISGQRSAAVAGIAARAQGNRSRVAREQGRFAVTRASSRFRTALLNARCAL